MIAAVGGILGKVAPGNVGTVGEKKCKICIGICPVFDFFLQSNHEARADCCTCTVLFRRGQNWMFLQNNTRRDLSCVIFLC